MFKDRLKNAWKSWTIWVNSIAASFVVILPVAQESIPQLQAYLPDHVYKLAMGVVIALNIALRFKTTSDLADK